VRGPGWSCSACGAEESQRSACCSSSRLLCSHQSLCTRVPARSPPLTRSRRVTSYTLPSSDTQQSVGVLWVATCRQRTCGTACAALRPRAHMQRAAEAVCCRMRLSPGTHLVGCVVALWRAVLWVQRQQKRRGERNSRQHAAVVWRQLVWRHVRVCWRRAGAAAACGAHMLTMVTACVSLRVGSCSLGRWVAWCARGVLAARVQWRVRRAAGAGAEALVVELRVSGWQWVGWQCACVTRAAAPAQT
jgi:hypothetical protein